MKEQNFHAFSFNRPGHLLHAIRLAKASSVLHDSEARFTFNGVDMRVREDSVPALLHRDFLLATQGLHRGPVGPYPPEELSDEVRRTDVYAEIMHEVERINAIQDQG